MPSLLLAAADAPELALKLRIPLSVMNFLEFAVWGAWFVVLGQYLNALKFTGKQIGSIYATMSLGTIVSPIFAGAVADRFLPAQVVLGVLHLAGAGLLFWMSQIRKPGMFYVAALLYALAYAPTIGLANGVMFSNIPDATRDAPTLRVWGTIGWIAANLFLKVLLMPGKPVNNRPLILASVLSLIFGVYSFLLPNTPPSENPNPFPFLDALKLLNDPSFAVFFGISFLITIALAFYYSFTSLYLEQRIKVRSDNVGPLMTIGQWTEIFFMAGFPILVNGDLQLVYGMAHFLDENVLGMKGVMAVGMAAWVIRYGIFTLARPFPLVVLGLALHGICYDYFFQAGFIYVANTAPKDIVNSSQSLFATLTYGIGMYLGTEASGWTYDACTQTEVDPATGAEVKTTNWAKFWMLPGIMAAACLVAFLVLFQGK